MELVNKSFRGEMCRFAVDMDIHGYIPCVDMRLRPGCG